MPYKIVFEFTILALYQRTFFSTKMHQLDVLALYNPGRSYNLDVSVELDYELCENEESLTIVGAG